MRSFPLVQCRMLSYEETLRKVIREELAWSMMKAYRVEKQIAANGEVKSHARRTWLFNINRTYAVYRNMPQHLVYLISNKSQDVEVLRKS